MTIISTCFDKTVHSVIMSIPDLEELYNYKRCVRKYSRVKMRTINYYRQVLNKEEDGDQTKFFVENMNLLR
jgi:hypothetical protein